MQIQQFGTLKLLLVFSTLTLLSTKRGIRAALQLERSSRKGVKTGPCNKLSFQAALFDDGFSETNMWRTFDNWECNVPPATIDGFAIAPIRNGSIAGINETVSGIFLFGGQRFHEQQLTQNETWFFDVEEQLWSKIETNNHPQPRSNHTMVTLCDKTVVLMGGKSLQNVQNLTDVWILNIKTAEWIEIIPDGESSGQGPSSDLLYNTTARVALQTNSTCHCQLSVIVPTQQNWAKLWELRCIQDRQRYEWSPVTLTGDSPSNLFIEQGRLTASAVSQGVIHALTDEGLWTFSLSNRQWKKQGSTYEQNTSTAGNDNILTYLEEKGQLLLISIKYKTLSMHETFSRSENVSWREGIMVGNSPVRLINTYNIRGGIKYHVAVVGPSIIAYGGSTSGCEQLTWILQETAVNCTPVWTWLRVPDAPLEPKRINQRPIVNFDKSIYVYGYSTLNGTNAQLWRASVDEMKWWQLRRGSPPRLDGGIAVALPELSTLVFSGPAKSMQPNMVTRLETWVYSTQYNKWTKITTPPELWYRRRYSLIAVNSTSALLFGGKYSNESMQNDTVYYSNIWLLSFQLDNLANSHWELIALTENSSKPKPRFAHSSVPWGAGMVIFGGRSNSDTCFRDLWYFNAENITWERWHPNNSGPDLLLERDCFSSATAVGSHVLITTGWNSKYWKTSNKQCSGDGEYQTWLYLPHLKTWRFINWISALWGIQTTTTFTYQSYALIANTATSFQLKYMLLGCPRGLYSPNIAARPCYPCPVGKYSSEDGKNCTPCPHGVRTSLLGAKSESDCNMCQQDQCEHGVCYIEHQQGKPRTVCHCHIGFSGSKCHSPTYYIVALAIVTTLIVVGLSVWKVVRIIIRKRHRERELTRQVRELTSVWQIQSDELTFDERIGAGGFGQVYRAQYREMTVVVKILRAPDDQQSLSEFEREIKFMQTVRHPYIVMFIGAGRMEDDKQPFLVAEYMPRGSLRDVLDDRDVTLNVTRCLGFALDAARGMAFLHSLKPPRIHNDLKSDNLLVSNNWVVKVSDFGSGLELHLARARRSRRDSITTPLLIDGYEMQPVGAARWRAPEVSSKHTSPSAAADVYSFAIVLWELWTRQRPFEQYRFNYQVTDAVQDGQRPDIPPICLDGYAQLIHNCWQQQPADRPHFSAIVQRLHHLVSIHATY